MKRKRGNNASIPQQIYKNTLLRSKIDAALDIGTRYEDIITMAKELYDVALSSATLSRYAKAREQANKTGENLGDILDSKKKAALSRIKSKETKPVNPPAKKEQDKKDEEFLSTGVVPTGEVTNYATTDQVIDEVISRGMQGLVDSDAPVPVKDLLKAVEIKSKLDGGRTGGISAQGLQELQAYSIAKESAMSRVLMKYVPEEKQQEALDMMDAEEKAALERLEITPQGKYIIKAMKGANVKI